MKIKALVSLGLFLASSAALANDWYLLGEVTHSRDKLDTGSSDQQLTTAGATGLTSSGKGNGNQWRLQLGYQFNPNFALEGGYIDFGKAKYSAAFSNPGTAGGTVRAGGVDLAALGILPITDSLSLFGKAGVAVAHVKSGIETTGGVAAPGSRSTNAMAPLLGLGMSYKIGDNTDLRAEYDHVNNLGKAGKVDKLTSDMVSLGVVYHFR